MSCIKYFPICLHLYKNCISARGTNCKRHAYSVTTFRASRDHARDARFNLNVNKLINMRNHAVWIIIGSCSDSTSKAACLFSNTEKSTLTKKRKKKKLRSNHRGHLVSPQKSKMPIKYIFTLEQIQLKTYKKNWWVYNMKYPPPSPQSRKNKDFLA